MSRSPLAAVGPTERAEYEAQWDATARLVRRGGSWSGRERHCVFLNTGGSRFADVSAPSGLATDADGRAVAIVDWDLDGDLDLWLANRSAPRLAFQRNESPVSEAFLALRLEGAGRNRDAIGARVELFRDGRTDPAAVATVRAGDGFLTQSSRWVHFGLADTRTVDAVAVRWPDGARERFEGLEGGRRYRLVQGSGAPREWRVPERTVALAPAPLEVPPPSDRATVHPSRLLPMPRFAGSGHDGEPVSIHAHRGHPLLVNLWASWCAPCVAELKAMTRRADELREAGIAVLALTVDGLGDDDSTPAKAAELLARIDFPFDAAPATTAFLDKLELLHGTLYMDLRPFPLPTSFLVDGEGRLVTIYRGPVEVEAVVADARREPADAAGRRARSVPFGGRWIAPPTPPRLLDLSERFLAEGHHADAADYYRLILASGSTDAEMARVHYNLASILTHEAATGSGGDGAATTEIEEHLRAAIAIGDMAPAHAALGELLLQRGDTAGALAALTRAVELDGDLGGARFALGNLLAARDDLEGATEHLRAAARLAPDTADVHNNLGVVLARRGLVDEAAAELAEAARLDSENPQAVFNLALAHEQQDDPAAVRADLERVLALDPDHVRAREWLADLCAEAGETRAAVAHYERVVRTDPDAIRAADRLAWILATSGDDSLRDGARALHLAEGLERRTGGEDAGVLDTLAAALAAEGRFEDAVQAAERALSVARSAGGEALSGEIEARLEGYREERAVRE